MVSKWWPGFRKTTSRRFFAEAGSSVSSLAPSLSKATPACARMPHSQPNSTSRRALRKAKAVGPSILGVVMRREGLGLRTKECDFESVVGQVYSEEEAKRFIGERWEATNLPLSWSKGAVQAFLAGWPCTVEASFRAGKTRSAIIRSAVPLPHRRLQHDFGCSLIRPAEPSKRQRAQVIVVKTGKTTVESQKAAKSWASVVRGNPTPPVTVKRPLAGSDSMDTTALGAITPTQVQDNNQVSLSPRSQRMDTLQPPQSPVPADEVAQLQVLMASVQSTATTVGQLGGQLISLQTEVTVMKNADNEDDEFEEHDGFSSERGGHGRCPWRAKIQLCQTYAVLSGEKEGAVFKASRRVFVAFSSFAVLFCSARSSPTVNVSQVFARKEVQFSEKRWLFFAVSEGCGAAVTKESMLA